MATGRAKRFESFDGFRIAVTAGVVAEYFPDHVRARTPDVPRYCR
jgi:hypothetical protein